MANLYESAMKAFLSMFDAVPQEFRKIERARNLEMLGAFLYTRFPNGAWENGNGTMHTLDDAELLALIPKDTQRIAEIILDAQSKVCAEYLGRLFDAQTYTDDEYQDAHSRLANARHAERMEAAKHTDLRKQLIQAQKAQLNAVEQIITGAEEARRATELAGYAHAEALELIKTPLAARGIKLENATISEAIRAYRNSDPDTINNVNKHALAKRIEDAQKLLPTFDAISTTCPQIAQTWHTKHYDHLSPSTNLYTLACALHHIWRDHENTLDAISERPLPEERKPLRTEYLARWQTDSVSPIRNRVKKEITFASEIQNDLKKHSQKTQELSEGLNAKLAYDSE